MNRIRTIVTLSALAMVTPFDGLAQVLHPQWSPDGQSLVFYERIEDRALLHRLDVETREHAVIAADSGWYANPSWFPGADRLAFAAAPSGMQGVWDLFEMNLSTGEKHQLTDTPEREMHAAVSTNGDIAFVRMSDGKSDIWVRTAQGEEVRVTATDDFREFHPKWSADGARLVFDGSDGDLTRLTVWESESGSTRVVHEADHRVATPAFLNGTTLVFGGDGKDGIRNLFTIDLDGSNPTQLTDLGGRSGGPFPSPDGRRLAFHSDHEGGYAIYVMDLDSGDLERLWPENRDSK